MKVITRPSEKQIEDLQFAIQSAKNFIEFYESMKAPDIDFLKTCLCKVIDNAPNIEFLDSDILDNYGIEANDSQWVELTEDEAEENARNIKEVINDIEEFDSCRLSYRSSGSILITIFGDAYEELRYFHFNARSY